MDCDGWWEFKGEDPHALSEEQGEKHVSNSYTHLIKHCNRDDIFYRSTEKKEATFPGKASWMELQWNSMLWVSKSLIGDPAGEREAS